MSTTLDTRLLDKLIRESPAEVDRHLRETGFSIASDWAQGVNVATGALRNSILAESPKKMGDLHYRVQDGVEYGIYQELGTSRMAAHPALIPAVERNWQPFIQGFADAIKRMVGGV
jgi:HK97 gp10 family phage protein